MNTAYAEVMRMDDIQSHPPGELRGPTTLIKIQDLGKSAEPLVGDGEALQIYMERKNDPDPAKRVPMFIILGESGGWDVGIVARRRGENHCHSYEQWLMSLRETLDQR